MIISCYIEIIKRGSDFRKKRASNRNNSWNCKKTRATGILCLIWLSLTKCIPNHIKIKRLKACWYSSVFYFIFRKRILSPKTISNEGNQKMLLQKESQRRKILVKKNYQMRTHLTFLQLVERPHTQPLWIVLMM